MGDYHVGIRATNCDGLGSNTNQLSRFSTIVADLEYRHRRAKQWAEGLGGVVFPSWLTYRALWWAFRRGNGRRWLTRSGRLRQRQSRKILFDRRLDWLLSHARRRLKNRGRTG